MPRTPAPAARLLAATLRPERAAVARILVVLTVTMGLTLSTPVLLGVFVDQAVDGEPLAELLRVAGLYTAAALGGEVLKLTVLWSSVKLSWRAGNRLREQLAEHALRLDLGWHARHSPGQLIERIDGDVEAMGIFFANVVLEVLGNALLVIGMVTVAFAIDPLAGAVLLAIVVLGTALLVKQRAVAVPAREAEREANAILYGDLEERLGGLEDLRANGAGPYAVHRLHVNSARTWRAARLSSWKGDGSYSLTAMAFGAGSVATLAIGFALHRADVISVGAVLSLYRFADMLRQPLERIAEQMKEFQKAFAGARRASTLLATEPSIVDGTLAIPPGPLTVELDRVTFSYRAGAPVLCDVDLTLKPGRHVARRGRRDRRARGRGRRRARAAPGARRRRVEPVRPPASHLDLGDARRRGAGVTKTLPGTGTARVSWRIARNEPAAWWIAQLSWLAFHLMTIPIGFVLKLALDRIADGDGSGAVWTVLAVILGLEVARWSTFAFAAFQWHGTWIGWLTVPRVNALSSLATGGGPVAGRLPGSPGEAVSRFRDDAQDIGHVLDGWLDLTASLVSASIGVAIMASIDPIAGVAVSVPVGIALLISWRLGPRLRAWRRSAREATGRVTGFIGDTFSGVLAVQSGAAEAAVHERFREINAARATLARRDQLGGELVRSLGYGTGEVTIGIVLLVVAASFRRGELSVGDIGLFAFYVTIIASLPKWAARVSAYQRQADVSIDRLAALLPDRDRRAIAAPVRTHLRHGPPPLELDDALSEPLDELVVEGLTVRYVDGRPALDGVDLLVGRGELVVVTGRVGAGKSTLLRAVLGLVARQSGSVVWNGAVIEDPGTVLVPPRVAYLPQVPRLFSESLAETVLLGRDPEGLERALWLTCLDEDLRRMPDGTGTLIGPRGLRLSGGQVQRTGAARALVRRPELLVVDDLSSALDVETEARLWQRVDEGGFATALLVSHRPQVLDRADRVIVLEQGRVVG